MLTFKDCLLNHSFVVYLGHKNYKWLNAPSKLKGKSLTLILQRWFHIIFLKNTFNHLIGIWKYSENQNQNQKTCILACMWGSKDASWTWICACVFQVENNGQNPGWILHSLPHASLHSFWRSLTGYMLNMFKYSNYFWTWMLLVIFMLHMPHKTLVSGSLYGNFPVGEFILTDRIRGLVFPIS